MGSNLGSTTMRNVSDVAMTAANVYVRLNGVDEDVYGTSCAAPLWAGFTALVNQQAAVNQQPALGFLNPTLAVLSSGTGYAAEFRDVTSGNNFDTSSPAKFPAVPGYDLCTGWGTPNGTTLINALASPADALQTSFATLTAGGPFVGARAALR